MKVKTKKVIVKASLIVLLPLYFIFITCIFTSLGAADIWGNMFDNGIDNIQQWCTLILYRVLLYVSPAFILSFIRFDKRQKWSTRLIDWFNWSLFVYLLWNAIIKLLAIDLLLNIEIFNVLDSFVALFGYIITYFKKQEILAKERVSIV